MPAYLASAARGRVRRGPPAYTPWPLEMAILYPAMAWFDGSVGYTLNAEKVSAHEDRINGGADYTVTQATAGQQPEKAAVGFVYSAASQTRLAGAPAVAAMIRSGPCTVFSRAKTASLAAQTIWCAGRVVSSPGHCTHRSGNGTANIEGVARNNHEVFTGADLGSTQRVLTWQWNGTQVGSRVDGAASALGTPVNQAGDPYDLFVVGARIHSGLINVPYTGAIDDIIVIPAALTVEQCQAGEAWLASRPPL